MKIIRITAKAARLVAEKLNAAAAKADELRVDVPLTDTANGEYFIGVDNTDDSKEAVGVVVVYSVE